MKFRPLAIIICIALAVGGCETIKELAAFLQCKFRNTSLSQVTLAGVNVDKVKNFSELNLSDAAQVAANVLQGKLPLVFTINMEIQNPNAQLAALDKIEYIALLDGTQIATGSTTQRVVIQPNNGTANMPITIGTDLFKMFNKSELERLKNLVVSLRDASGKPSSHLALKIKPTITLNGKQVQFPNYITVGNTFTSAY